MDRNAMIAAAQSVSSVGELGALLQRLRTRQARRRRASVLTYRELATRLGCSHGIVGAYLSGRVLPPVERFDRLILELGASRTECGALATARDRLDDERRVGPAGWPLPRQLPAAVTPLIGRRSALAALEAQHGNGTTVVLTGPAGLGKTALAVHWAYQVVEDFPDGQLYADLSGSAVGRAPRDPADVLAGFLHALGFPPESLPPDLDGRARLYRSLLARRRVLVLLDDAGDAAQVRPLLPGSPACQVLITSRAPLTGLVAVEGAELILLGPLDPQQSRTLLEARLGRQRTGAEPVATNTIVASCGGNPLALAMAAAHAVVRPDLTLAAVAHHLTAGAFVPPESWDRVTDAAVPHCPHAVACCPHADACCLHAVAHCPHADACCPHNVAHCLHDVACCPPSSHLAGGGRTPVTPAGRVATCRAGWREVIPPPSYLRVAPAPQRTVDGR